MAGIAPAPATAQRRTVPRGAFLRHPVASVPEFLHQVKTDPLLAQRYCRLLGMSPQMVRLAVADLRLVRTKTALVRKVYYVHPGEVIGYRVRRIKAGTLVFATPEGTPVLMQVCGNAIRPVSEAALSTMPTITDYSDSEEEPTARTTGRATNHVLRSAQPGTELAALTKPAPPSDFVVERAASRPPGPPLPGIVPIAASSAVAGEQLLQWVGAATVVEVVTTRGGRADSGGLNGTGGGNSGGGNNGGNNFNNSLAPEPNSALLFAFAGAGCLAYKAARQRRRAVGGRNRTGHPR